MKPVVLGASPGWLHEADGSCGVIMCGALGYEALCAHKNWRLMADAIAARGFPCLRFDYHGTGDALGRDRDPARLEAWISSIEQAIRLMRGSVGVSRVVLVGLRIGSALATMAAARLGAIDGLILLAPTPSGRAYTRELEALSNMIMQPPSAPQMQYADGLEVAGHLITPETMAALNAINLGALQTSPAAKALILAAASQNSADRLAAHLETLGCACTRDVFEHHAALMSDATFSRYPAEAMDKLLDWLTTHFDTAARAVTVADTTLPAVLTGEGFCEELVQFGPSDRLSGVICCPGKPAADLPTLIFLNAGANPHIGWARMSVDVARRFSGLGITSLRMDAGGIGDSADVAERPTPVLYTMEPRDDVAAALDLLQARGLDNFALVGLCSGAHLCFHSSIKDDRIKHAVLVNLQKFIWKDGMSLEIAYRDAYQASGHYWSKLFDFGTWKRVLRGEVKSVGIARELTKRIFGKAKASSQAMLGAVVPQAGGDVGQVRSWFNQLTGRGVRMLFIYSSDDAGRDELSLFMGRDGALLKALPDTTLAYIDGADHNLTPRWAREAYTALLKAFVLGGALAEKSASGQAGVLDQQQAEQ